MSSAQGLIQFAKTSHSLHKALSFLSLFFSIWNASLSIKEYITINIICLLVVGISGVELHTSQEGVQFD